MNYRISRWKKFNIDPIMMIIVISLLIYSCIIIWSASAQNIMIIINKLLQIIIGFIIMIGIAQYPPDLYKKTAPYWYIICIFLLIIVNLFGTLTKGSHRWINIGIMHFQPSEIANITTPLMISSYMSNNVYPIKIQHVITALILISIPTGLVLIEPDLGTAIIIAISGIVVLFISDINWSHIAMIIGLIISLIPIFWFCLMHDYQRLRITTMFHPELDPLRAGYHIIQSKIAIGSGGLYGKGWLHGTQTQLNFLPACYTDFIFAVLAEELGLIGVLILMFLYLSLILRGFVICLRATTIFQRITTAGLVIMIFLYIFINIGMVIGILPVVGIPLPLMSYGGSALVVLMAGFGMIMSISNSK